MAQRQTNQNRANDGKYEKNERCALCSEDLGQLDDGQWEFYGGDFICLDCGRKLDEQQEAAA